MSKITEPQYSIREGMDGRNYAVFRDELARSDYEDRNPGEFRGCQVVSFGQYENAFSLEDGR